MNHPMISTVLTAAGLPQYPNPYSLSALQQMHHADRPYVAPVQPAKKPSVLERLVTSVVEKAGRRLRQKNAGVSIAQPNICQNNCLG